MILKPKPNYIRIKLYMNETNTHYYRCQTQYYGKNNKQYYMIFS